MPRESEYSLRVLIHVGPHKTATTSIQYFLRDQAPRLAEQGLFVPTDAENASHMGHHLMPFLLRGWDQTFIGLNYTGTVDDLLTTWLTEAVEASCHTLVLSSEEFATLTRKEWSTLDKALARVAKRANVTLEGLAVFFTDRDMVSRLRSLVLSSYAHGTALSPEQVEKLVLADFARDDKTIEDLPEFMTLPTTVTRVAMTPGNFVKTWALAVFGFEVVDGLPGDAFDLVANVSVGDEMANWLRDFNGVSTPIEDLDKVAPLTILNTAERRRASTRRYMVLQLLLEGKQLRREIEDLSQNLDALQSSFSWHVTRPLRAIRSWFT